MALGLPFKVVLTAPRWAEELQFTVDVNAAADALFSANPNAAADFTDKFEDWCWAPIFVTNEDANGKFGMLLVLPPLLPLKMVGSDRNWCGSDEEAQDILFIVNISWGLFCLSKNNNKCKVLLVITLFLGSIEKKLDWRGFLKQNRSYRYNCKLFSSYRWKQTKGPWFFKSMTDFNISRTLSIWALHGFIQ